MMRLEQLRAEMIDRFERVDRRFAQQEQRLERLNQRASDLADRIEAIGAAIGAQLTALQARLPDAPPERQASLEQDREDLVVER